MRSKIWGYLEQCEDESLAMRDELRALGFVVIDTSRDAVHDRIHPEGLQHGL